MKSAILATLCYSDIFDFPPTKDEIWKYLINKSQISNLKSQINSKSQIQNSKQIFNNQQPFDLAQDRSTINNQGPEFDQALKQLLEEKKIGRLGNYYFLFGRQETVELRKKREQCSQQKMEIAQKAIDILRFVPFVRMIAVSGALAINNAKDDDDIDFFIIAQKNTLWLIRLLVVLLLLLFGLYRRPGKIKNKICPNMYLADNNLEIPENEQGLFIAHELVQIKPLFDRNNTYQKFTTINKWLLDYLPNAFDLIDSSHHDTLMYHGGICTGALSGIISFIDFILMKLQLFYMCRKRTKEVLCRDIIRFHPEDVRSRVETEYRKKLSDLM